MTHDILTRIKDACDRAVAEGYTLGRGSYGVYWAMNFQWKHDGGNCLCAMGALAHGRAGSGMLEYDAAESLDIEQSLIEDFIRGFDCPPESFIWNRQYLPVEDGDWVRLGHACALYYVDGVRL